MPQFAKIPQCMRMPQYLFLKYFLLHTSGGEKIKFIHFYNQNICNSTELDEQECMERMRLILMGHSCALKNVFLVFL